MFRLKIKDHLSSPSVQLGAGVGFLMYVSYAISYQAFASLELIFLSIFIGIFIPYYSKFCNRLEEKVNLHTAKISYGRLARFLPQLLFNVIVFEFLTQSDVIPVGNIQSLGGIFGVALLTTLASQGMQYLALALSNREIGEKTRNVVIALSINIAVTAVATLGFPAAKLIFLVSGIIFGAVFFAIGFLSDARAIWFARGGVGIFFGTFNPIHRTHLELMRKAIDQRSLQKIYIHCTNIPRLHSKALDSGEIKIARFEHGMRVYETTSRADVHANYFPTGRKFYEYETRLEMMRLAIAEAGLAEKVEVLDMPDLYEKGGFYSILSEIKRKHPGVPVHGIHGSDLGGMWVRSIYDESGWVYPFPVVRKDGVSATAIRNGAADMTTHSVQKMISVLRDSKQLSTHTLS
jgi:nicotinic acid mononucleotide adenylyltransferase